MGSTAMSERTPHDPHNSAAGTPFTLVQRATLALGDELSPSTRTSASDVDRAYYDFLVALDATLARLHPDEIGHLFVAVSALVKAGFEQKRLADVLGTSRTTISRWAVADNLPPDPDLREGKIKKLRGLLREEIKRYRPEGTLAAPQA